ncbi:hypothetical protein LguiB_013279 [Lonicera macranthoides]
MQPLYASILFMAALKVISALASHDMKGSSSTKDAQFLPLEGLSFMDFMSVGMLKDWCFS